MDSQKLLVKNAKNKGRGVFAKEKVRKGTEVAAFDGRVYGWSSTLWNDDLYNHVIQFAERKWRDSAGIARIINHSCDPNCGIKDFFRIVAMRDIKAGEEITWDYEMTEDHPSWRMDCRCGSRGCRKVIGAHKNMPPAVRRKYDGYISEWLIFKYKSAI